VARASQEGRGGSAAGGPKWRGRLSFCGKEPISFPRPAPPLVSAT
jgi:hypothetical protein